MAKHGNQTKDLQGRVEGQALLINDLYVIVHEGELDVERWSTRDYIYCESAQLRCTFAAPIEDVNWALDIIQRELVLDELAEIRVKKKHATD